MLSSNVHYSSIDVVKQLPHIKNSETGPSVKDVSRLVSVVMDECRLSSK